MARTAPYGHNGAYPTWEGIIRQHLDCVAGFEGRALDMATLPGAPWLATADILPLHDRRDRAVLAARLDIASVDLTNTEVSPLVAFLYSLIGTESLTSQFGRPEAVPSGLEVD